MSHPFLLPHSLLNAVLCCSVLPQSVVTYTQKMQAAGKQPVIERPMYHQQAAGAAEADQDSDEEER